MRLTWVLVAVACCAVLVLSSPSGNTATFSDVPEDHWAYDWIEWLAGLGIVSGYDDGLYRPAAQVTRDQMAVYLGRVIQHVRPFQTWGFAVAPNSDFPHDLKLVAPSDIGASDYRLYESADAHSWSLAAGAMPSSGPPCMSGAVQSSVAVWDVTEVTTSRYFKPVAVINDVEHELCHLIMARPGETSLSIAISEPPATGASHVPTISWTAVPGAVAYTVAVVSQTPTYGDVWGAFVDPSRTSARFGEDQGPEVILAYQCLSVLEPNTTYHALVRAIDATGWTFASSGDYYFTTGP